MKLIRVYRALLAGGLLALLAVSAQAATIQLNYQHNLGSGTPSGHITGVSPRVFAGEFEFSTSNNSTDMIQWDDGLSAFCIQTSTFLQTSSVYTATAGLGSFTGTSQGTLIDRLFSSYYESSKSSQVGSAAFQLALWEIINEGTDSLNLGSGSFRASHFGSTTLNLAGSWLGSLDNNAASGVYDFYILTSDTSQDLITVTARVPEPAAASLLFIGLLALYRMRRRAS
ncbi:PEP-CTERM sorting domain-containing protein [Marinimicrobium sp. ABcell2]|uniref:PEP-CTERM sorting domain-containing protein n=1 Tax=Marinimicrobium sp. ABcell2 TaxID=3069751 RepID=UPI0027B2581E|nr:PEP-CTERM sorting domain-containing protein [Marinimicrobium sp. ABcell2]MDQ2075932.1 PEP-CTERM sorting domain-containing protein [Marinimicrobium sp. ABcell2]